MLDLTQLSITELTQGFHQQQQLLCCNYCQITFPITDQVLMTSHLVTAHGGAKHALLTLATKYNGLTETQLTLLQAFSTADKDQAVADSLDVSASTIRHQKFTFREKAKSAKLYLAQYQAVFGEIPVKAKQYLPVPPGVSQSDDQFKLTEADYVANVQKFFTQTGQQLQLTSWPKGEKKRFAITMRISQLFEFDRTYTLAEIDTQLKAISADFTWLKRYLIDDGFFDRTPDGRSYWRLF